MTLFEILTASLLTAGLTAALVGLLVKKMVESAIDFQVKKAELGVQADLAVRVPVRQEFFKKGMAIYPEIIEMIYRLKNAARDCSEDATRTRDLREEFSLLSILLTENLYKYRPFLPEEIFWDLHRYKILVQEYGVLLDHVTRSTEVESAPVDRKILGYAKEDIAEKYRTIESAHAALSPKIKEICKKKLNNPV